ncbi:MAG: transcriptional regulator [Clostridia bacterium]|nr:transcriptional regulator [Clostridia bacterium]
MNTPTLETLIHLASGLAAQFGENCEIVIHDLSAKAVEHSIVHIENGHITNREIGGGPSPIVLDTLCHMDHVEDKLAYLTQTENGRILKSSTIFIKDDLGIPRYILGINFDITNLLAIDQSILSLTGIKTQNKSEEKPDRISHDVNSLLDDLIRQSVDMIGIPAPLMSREDKIKAINYLNDAGAFLITKSGDKISKYFGISKYTLYSYVDINK